MWNSNWVHSMKWSGQKQSVPSKTVQFLVDGTKAGLLNSYGHGPLYFLKVNAAGHMVPMDQPKKLHFRCCFVIKMPNPWDNHLLIVRRSLPCLMFPSPLVEKRLTLPHKRILGDIFMGRYHTVFDYGKLRVGFAEAA